MFVLYSPPSLEKARQYITLTIFEEWLGVPVSIQPQDRKDWMLEREGKALHLPDIFFAAAKKGWLGDSTTKPEPGFYRNIEKELPGIKICATDVPALFAQKADKLISSEQKDSLSLSLDIFGSAFFMLTRYEETGEFQKDQHQRFSAHHSIAFKHRFLNRPIIDEYIEILWMCMLKLWPGLKRKQRTFSMRLTCDVDAPFDMTVRSFPEMSRQAFGALIKTTNPRKALETFQRYRQFQKGDVHADRFDTFDDLMTLAENYNLRQHYFFIVDNPAGRRDCLYKINDPDIIALGKKISKRGHFIGLHGSYTSYSNLQQMKREVKRLEEFKTSVSVNDKKDNLIWSRQHFLRWDANVTPSVLSKAGIQKDASLSYAEVAGFRCGTCHPFHLFDLHKIKKLETIEHPLIAMECSIIAEKYMNLGYTEKALEYLKDLKQKCKRMNGEFGLLWHNSHLTTKKDWNLLEETCKA